MFLYGLEVIENSFALRTESVKKHKKRHGQKDSYHRRIQKKWDKRFGTRSVPCAFKLGGNTLVVHPEIMKILRKTAISYEMMEVMRRTVPPL